jgi:two-component system, response regulator PdtaR
MVRKEPFSGYRVLVVEDELLIALEIRRTLEELGCDVVGPAGSIEKALALLETQRPDMAFLDEDLKGKPVTPVAETLRRLHIPFAILSGYDQSITGEEILVNAMRLQKPTPPPSIQRALEALCGDLQR